MILTFKLECYVSSAPRVATRRVCKGQIEELSAPSVKLSFQDDSIRYIIVDCLRFV